MIGPQFDVDAMTRLELLSAAEERLQALRMDGIGYESPKALERRVRVISHLVHELHLRERQEQMWRLP